MRRVVDGAVSPGRTGRRSVPHQRASDNQPNETNQSAAPPLTARSRSTLPKHLWSSENRTKAVLNSSLGILIFYARQSASVRSGPKLGGILASGKDWGAVEEMLLFSE